MAGTFFKNGSLVESSTTTATAAGTTTLTASDATNQQFTGTTTQIVVLPDASTLSVGRRFRVLNRSTGAITVNYNGGTLAATVAAGTETDFLCIVASSGAGTWDVSAGGSGSASGTTFAVTAGETLGANVPVYISVGSADGSRTAGRAYKLDATNANRYVFAGFTTAGISSGTSGTVQSSGYMAGFTSLTAASIYYGSIATPGAVQATAPEVIGQYVVSVGIAISTTEMIVDTAGGHLATLISTKTDPRVNYAVGNFGAEVDTVGWTTYSDTQTATMTLASPAVVTVASTTGLLAGAAFAFTTTGALPTGVTSGTTYYVSSIVSGTTFQFSATRGGTAVNTSGSQSGTHTFRPLSPVTASSNSLTGLTFSRNTSSPLRGVGDFKLAQTNSTVVAGQGVYFAFTIDPADEARVLKVELDFNADTNFSAADGITAPNSGGAGDSDLEFFIYDVTNAALIPLTPQVIAANGSNSFTFRSSFQTAPNSTSYRLCIHASKTSAAGTGYNFRWDSVYVGPQAVALGPAIMDFATIVPTLANAGNAAVTCNAAHVGDHATFVGTITIGSSLPTGTITLTMPAGYVIDTAKTTGLAVGVATGGNSGGTASFTGTVRVATTSTVIFYGDSGAGAWNATVPRTFAQNDRIDFTFTVAIVGWSSSTILSSDSDTRVTTSSVKLSADQTGVPNTGFTKVTFNTIVDDSHGAFSTNNNRYIIQTAGRFKFHTSIYWGNTLANASDVTVNLYKNGSSLQQLMRVNGEANQTVSGYFIDKCVPGDYYEIFVSQNSSDGNRTIQAGGPTYFVIERVTGPGVIAASETVACRYTGTASTTPTSLTATVIKYATKSYDTHGLYSTSTGLFTVQSPGKYQIEGYAHVSQAATAVSNAFVMQIVQNGSAVSQRYQTAFTTTSVEHNPFITDTIQCNAGDTIGVYIGQNLSVSNLTISNDNFTFLTIKRVGN